MTTAHEPAGAELASLLKSSLRFRKPDGVKVPGLRLADDAMQEWLDLKFGLFVHWGLYSIVGRGEWHMFNDQVPSDEYAALARQFTPRHFDAHEWARIARNAGMRYAVMVARHHDGFALWNSPSAYQGFDSVRTAAGRDFIAEYTRAFRAAGLRTGLYYSLMDWRFPGYFKPRELAESAEQMKLQCHRQLEELMTRYGRIDMLWYDGGWLAHKGTDGEGAWLWESGDLNRRIRDWQPHIVINERSGWEGDIETDEGAHPVTGPIMPIRWEKCFSLGRHGWGFVPGDEAMGYTEVLSLLVNTWVRGGNVLLNVGPDADGVVPADQVAVLERIGRFLETNGEAVFGTRPGPFQPVDDVYGATQRDGTIFLHVLDPLAFASHTLPNLPEPIVACRTQTGRPLAFLQDLSGIRVELPPDLDHDVDTIVRLERR